MLQVVLILSLIGATYCQTCSKTSAFKHNSASMQELSGTFYTTKTSSTNNIACELVTWYETGPDLYAIVESPGCCRMVHNPDYTNTNHVTFQVTPLSTGEGVGCLSANETAIFKFIGTTGSGDTLCIIISACRDGLEGIYVSCRQKSVSPNGFLAKITAVLLNSLSSLLLQLLYGYPTFTDVSQQGCLFPDKNCLLF